MPLIYIDLFFFASQGDKDLPRATFHNENSNRMVDEEVCHLTDVTYATDQNEKNLLWEEESEHKTCSN